MNKVRTKNKETRWWYKLPGNFYAYGPTRGSYTTERKAREAIAVGFENSKLPRGTELWREQ